VPVGGAQVQGPRRWRYGLLLHRGGWEDAGVLRRADEFLDPLEALAGPATANGLRPSAGQALAVAGAEVSAVRRDDRAGLAVRLFNPGSRPVTATVAGDRRDLRPGQIVTVRPFRRPGAG